MKIIISPAKTLMPDGTKIEIDEYYLPAFLKDSKKLIKILREFSPKELMILMKISLKLADINFKRFKNWTTSLTLENAKPAISTFWGDVYQGIDITSYQTEEIKLLQKDLYILSGLYGVLKPLDLIMPYRLEMGTPLKNSAGKNLYHFWKDKIAKKINSEITKNEFIINLASNEYFKVVTPYLKNPIITPIFKDQVKNNYRTISFWAKKARGLMVSFIIKNKITEIKELKKFNCDGYFFKESDEKKSLLVFHRNH